MTIQDMVCLLINRATRVNLLDSQLERDWNQKVKSMGHLVTFPSIFIFWSSMGGGELYQHLEARLSWEHGSIVENVSRIPQ